MGAVAKSRSLPKRAKKTAKKVAKSRIAQTTAAGGVGGFLGSRGKGGNNVAQTAKVKSTGFTEAELKAARKRIYGY